jgi:hypothetical protein
MSLATAAAIRDETGGGADGVGVHVVLSRTTWGLPALGGLIGLHKRLLPHP